MKNYSQLFIISLLSGAITLGAYKLFFEKDNRLPVNLGQPAMATYNVSDTGAMGANIDLTAAANKTINHVVHVKNTTYRRVYDPFAEFMFGQRGGGQNVPQIGTGSGVIISADGYVVTNYHVVKDAQELEVTLNNNRTYKAKMVGSDPKMDIALLKIDSSDLFDYSIFGDSDQVKIGEWVLAVGNPFNLTSTVTAGIVSAKARNLQQGGIQSFIQTDAAVNPGNSGGALVNTRGELVGINTMISSNTGSYVGYSFAVPSNVARKIVEDLMEFGNVQRGLLGIEGVELNTNAAKEFGVNDTQGFYVNNVTKNSGAAKSGIQKGDIIVQLDNRNIRTMADVNEHISTKRPNEEIDVKLKRGSKMLTIPVKLSKKELLDYSYYGFELEELNDDEKRKYGLNEGVKIKEIKNEKFMRYANRLRGSIILKINGEKVTYIERVTQILGGKSDDESIEMEVYMRDGTRASLML
jgi:Do/DeqQ family serine protease